MNKNTIKYAAVGLSLAVAASFSSAAMACGHHYRHHCCYSGPSFYCGYQIGVVPAGKCIMVSPRVLLRGYCRTVEPLGLTSYYAM